MCEVKNYHMCGEIANTYVCYERNRIFVRFAVVVHGDANLTSLLNYFKITQ